MKERSRRADSLLKKPTAALKCMTRWLRIILGFDRESSESSAIMHLQSITSHSSILVSTRLCQERFYCCWTGIIFLVTNSLSSSMDLPLLGLVSVSRNAIHGSEKLRPAHTQAKRMTPPALTSHEQKCRSHSLNQGQLTTLSQPMAAPGLV